MVVMAALELLALLESFAAVTVAVLEILPSTLAPTEVRIVTTAVSPGLRVGIVTDAVPLVAETVPAVVEPMSEVPLTKVNPVGKASLTCTLVAVDGPELVTFSV